MVEEKSLWSLSVESEMPSGYEKVSSLMPSVPPGSTSGKKVNEKWISSPMWRRTFPSRPAYFPPDEVPTSKNRDRLCSGRTKIADAFAVSDMLSALPIERYRGFHQGFPVRKQAGRDTVGRLPEIDDIYQSSILYSVDQKPASELTGSLPLFSLDTAMSELFCSFTNHEVNTVVVSNKSETKGTTPTEPTKNRGTSVSHKKIIGREHSHSAE
jgi:hypothetical protein